MSVLLRFAPSPTGALHLGGLRTALFNHLYARRLGGKWILRIEDTDATRAVPGSVDGIRAGLDWAGLEYDYGPGKGGPHAPYLQSERLDLYHAHAQTLIDSGHAYRCFCTPDRLADTRAALARTGSNATYDRACLHGVTDEDAARRVRAGERYIVRFNDTNVPPRTPAPDLVFGALSDSHASLPTDAVLLKSDRFPTYHLASVVDDGAMGITHVLRGEEWLPSLPLHLDLYAALRVPPPRFAHLPLLLNPDGTKMSKRRGDVGVADFVKRGWEPEALLNWLALPGWGVTHDSDSSTSSSSSSSSSSTSASDTHHAHAAPSSTEVMTLPEMIREFDLAALTPRRSMMDPAKLAFLNRHHLARTAASPPGLAALAARAAPLVRAAFPASEYTTTAHIESVFPVLEGRLETLNDVPAAGAFYFGEPDLLAPDVRRALLHITPETYVHALDTALARLERVSVEHWARANLHEVVQRDGEGRSAGAREYMTAIRLGLSGAKTGPSVRDMLRVLGRERALERLRRARALVVQRVWTRKKS